MPPTDPTTAEEKYELITHNLQETLNGEIIKEVLEKGERPLKIYWGTAPTGRPHCGYFVPMLKLAEFLKAGCSLKVLLADIHSFLDASKSPLELITYRSEYYRRTITALLKAVNVPTDRLTFVMGSEYQLSEKYTMDNFRLMSVVSMHDALRAGAEVVKQSSTAPLSNLVYPLMQALDEEYLDVDAQFGGVDQRKIFALAKEVLPKIGYKERAHLMNPMVPGLAGGKMSSSDPDSKIDVLDGPEVVKRKIKKAFAMPKQVEENGLLSFVEYVLLPVSLLKSGEQRFVVQRREGEPLVYSTIQAMQDDYRADVLTPQLLKLAVTDALNDLLAPIQEEFTNSPDWQKLEKDAYPPPPAPEKKKKEKKDKGSRYPGGQKPQDGVVAQPDGSVTGPNSHEVNVAKSVDDALKNLELGQAEK